MPEFTTRPTIMGTRGVVTSGHYLATAAGFRIMEQGGNAIDAAATMCFCLNLLEPQSNPYILCQRAQDVRRQRHGLVP